MASERAIEVLAQAYGRPRYERAIMALPGYEAVPVGGQRHPRCFAPRFSVQGFRCRPNRLGFVRERFRFWNGGPTEFEVSSLYLWRIGLQMVIVSR